MNYHDYDSRGNKKKINFNGLWSDKMTRSRIILLFYFLLFLGLVIYIRANISDNGDQLEDKREEVIVDDERQEEDLEIRELFSLLSKNNYNFDFQLKIDNDEYTYNGKRYSNKIMYSFNNLENDLGTYISDGNLTKVKLLEEDYAISDSPYYGFNYFEVNILKDILNNADKIEEDIYSITNEKFDKYYDKNRHYINMIDKELTNEIKLETKNGKIVGMTIDYSNYAKNDSSFTFSSVVISLKYSNFDLIDDFSIDFK